MGLRLPAAHGVRARRSIATPGDGVTGEVLEVRSFEELRAAGDAAKGKIIFFNRPFDPRHINTFGAYGGRSTTGRWSDRSGEGGRDRGPSSGR